MTTPTDKATDIKERLERTIRWLDKHYAVLLKDSERIGERLGNRQGWRDVSDAIDRIAALEAEQADADLLLGENWRQALNKAEGRPDQKLAGVISEHAFRIEELKAERDALLQGLAANGCEVTHATDGTGPWVLNFRADNVARQCAALAAEVERLREVVGKLLWRGGRLYAALTNDDWYSDAVLDEWGDAVTEAAEAARGTA